MEEQGLSQAARGRDKLREDWPEWSDIVRGQGAWWFCGMPWRPNPGACLLPPHSRPGMLGTWALAPEDSDLSHCPQESSPREVCPRAWSASSSSPPSSTWQDCSPCHFRPMHTQVGPLQTAVLGSGDSEFPFLTLHPGTYLHRWLAAREWSRRPFPVTSDAEFFLTWKVIRSLQSLCTWPCAGGSALVLPR